jgi:hypothetical protein
MGCTSPVDLIDAAKARIPASSNCFRGWWGLGRIDSTGISVAPVATPEAEARGRVSKAAGATSASTGSSETEINDDNPLPKRGLAALDTDDMIRSFPRESLFKKFHVELFQNPSLAAN